MRRLLALLVLLALVALLAGCGDDPDTEATAEALLRERLTASATLWTETPAPSETPDLPGTVEAEIAAALAATAEAATPTPAPTETLVPSETPDLPATVEAELAAALTATAARWTVTPSATHTATPDLDATVDARALAALTATAQSWTATPTPDLNTTVGVEVALALTATADQWTATPTVFISPTPTLIPNTDAADDDAFLGPEDAPVVLVEFSDFQCGFCGRWYDQTLPLILEAYPDEVKFVHRDFPIFGDDSIRAAMATECAEEQGAFWEMHNALFDAGLTNEFETLDEAALITLAGRLELDTDAFTSCLRSERYLEEVFADREAAVGWGMPGTPSFVINGTVYLVGAQSFDVFDRIIQAELAAVQE